MTTASNRKLFLISFSILFLELALIRWLSTEMRIFAYVNNLVLLACFLGIGLGCYYASAAPNMSATLARILVLMILGTIPIVKELPQLLSVFHDEHIWFAAMPQHVLLAAAAGLLATLSIFTLIAAAFLPLGQILSRLLAEHPHRIFAYSLNVAASLLGVWGFSLLSFLYAPPWVWLLASLICLAWFVPRTRSAWALMAGLMAMLAIMAIHPLATQQRIIWSPYQKLQVAPLRRDAARTEYLLKVNNVNYMALLDLSDRPIAGPPEALQRYRLQRRFSQYDIPYAFHPGAQDVLIVGAGGGNDAAGALRNGARRVTAVEIDPGIIALGRALHPEAPYTDPGVEVVIDDARSFFKKCRKRFDVISFGLLDSHTLGSALTNTRLDHYVYTMESFREARALLKPDGVMTVIFEVPRPWVRERIRGLLREAFGAEPVAFENRHPNEELGWGGEMYVISNNMPALRQTLAQNDALRAFVEARVLRSLGSARLTTDNWPYLYLERARIPALHLWLSVILIVVLLSFRRSAIPAGQRLDGHFFFLGAAFLLLEFQNISKTTLVFGSTWLVNAFTISAILSLILLANAVTAVWKTLNVHHVYAGLLLSIAVIFLVPLNAFNALAYWPRCLAVSVLLNLPIFFAGIIFVHSFHRTPNPGVAFGSNLLGAGVGGILESLSFVTGVNFLLVLVGLLYVASLAYLATARTASAPVPGGGSPTVT